MTDYPFTADADEPANDMYHPQCFRDSSELKIAPKGNDHA